MNPTVATGVEAHAIETGTTTATGEDTDLDRGRGADTGTARGLRTEGTEIATAIGTDPGRGVHDIMMIEGIDGKMMMMDLGIVVMMTEIDELNPVAPHPQAPAAPSHDTTSLPTRTRPDNNIKREPNPNMSFNVSKKSPPRRDDAPDGDEMDAEDDDMAAMQAMMGFGGFGTTKNKKVAGNNVGGVSKEKKTEYRQYMNRQGGFNRPLSPSR
ncbi:hypothetical protein NW754_014649 [Fusarium falciforme]|nr:hypothetical protein NW754_014649 [Fusarium falciforme]